MVGVGGGGGVVVWGVGMGGGLAATTGVSDMCPPLKEVINSSWPQVAKDQETWVGGNTCH